MPDSELRQAPLGIWLLVSVVVEPLSPVGTGVASPPPGQNHDVRYC